MSKLIRFDEDHFGYLIEYALDPERVEQWVAAWAEAWPGKRLIIMTADEFIDLTGQYEIVPIPDAMQAVR